MKPCIMGEPLDWGGFFHALGETLDSGVAAALATVIDTRGSTPQKPGAAMAVLANGKTLGTVGGGCVEGRIRSACLDALHRSRQARVIEVSLTDDVGQADGDICGGSMRILIEHLA